LTDYYMQRPIFNIQPDVQISAIVNFIKQKRYLIFEYDMRYSSPVLHVQ